MPSGNPSTFNMDEIALKPLGELSEGEYKEVIPKKEYFPTLAEYSAQNGLARHIRIYVGSAKWYIPKGYFFYITNCWYQGKGTDALGYVILTVEGLTGTTLLKMAGTDYNLFSLNFTCPIRCSEGDYIFYSAVDFSGEGAIDGYLVKI